MKKRISLYDYCKETAENLFQVRILSYDDYLKYQAKEPISKETFNLFTDDTYLLRASLLYVWMFDYCHKNNMLDDSGQFGYLTGKAIAQSYVQKLFALGFSDTIIESKLSNLTDNLDDVISAFFNSQDLSKSNIDILNKFAQYYCATIFRKYNVSPNDVNAQSALVSFVQTQLAVLDSMMGEWLKHYRIVKGK